MTDSKNFRGISLSSLFGNILDYAISSKFHDNLYTSDLQFGFKQNSSTNMCTMQLKETVAYYLNKESPVLYFSCSCDRVNYCKLRLLIKRDLPACIIRVLITMYTGHFIRISWDGVCLTILMHSSKSKILVGLCIPGNLWSMFKKFKFK